MTFDLHTHSEFSDGSITISDAHHYLAGHCDYRAVTDHFSADFHRQHGGYCSFTGMEIASYFSVSGVKFSADFLIYGYELNHPIIPSLETCYMEVPKLFASIQSLRDAGAKIFHAHPFRTFGWREPEPIVEYLAEYVDGFECLHPSSDYWESIYLLEFCRRNYLLASGGSDSHTVPLELTPYLYLMEEYKELFTWIPEMARRFENEAE